MSDANNKKGVWIVSYTRNTNPMVADAEQYKKYVEDIGY